MNALANILNAAKGTIAAMEAETAALGEFNRAYLDLVKSSPLAREKLRRSLPHLSAEQFEKLLAGGLDTIDAGEFIGLKVGLN